MGAIVDILLILIVILFILLIWRGPSMLPQLGEALGKAVRGVRENVDADAGKRGDGVSASSAREDDAPAREDDALAREGDAPDPAEQDPRERERDA